MRNPTESQFKGSRRAFLMAMAIVVTISGGTIIYLVQIGETGPIPHIVTANVVALLVIGLECLLIPRLQKTDLIKAVHHTACAEYHIYDLLLISTYYHYGWNAMLRWADHFVDTDLQQLLLVNTSDADHNKNDYLAQVEQVLLHGGKLSETPELAQEQASLLVFGRSQAFNGPLGILWITHDSTLRVYSPVEDEKRIRTYVEALLTGQEVNIEAEGA